MNKKNTYKIAILIFLLTPLISAISISEVSNIPSQVAPGETMDVFITIKNILIRFLHNLFFFKLYFSNVN